MKKTNNKSELIETTNSCILKGTIEKILFQNEKIAIFNFKTYRITANDKQGYCFMTVKLFKKDINIDVEKDDTLELTGYIANEKTEDNKGNTYYNTYVLTDIGHIKECEL